MSVTEPILTFLFGSGMIVAFGWHKLLNFRRVLEVGYDEALLDLFNRFLEIVDVLVIVGEGYPKEAVQWTVASRWFNVVHIVNFTCLSTQCI